jgi:hypothetical protein
MAGKKHASLFVGQWAAPLLLMGVSSEADQPPPETPAHRSRVLRFRVANEVRTCTSIHCLKSILLPIGNARKHL